MMLALASFSNRNYAQIRLAAGGVIGNRLGRGSRGSRGRYRQLGSL